MDILKILAQQDMQVLVPCSIAALVILNWVMKLVMMVVKIGVTISLIAAVCVYLPHLS